MKKTTIQPVIITTIAIEVVALICAYFFWLKEISWIICLLIMLTIIDYLIFSILEFYSFGRLKEQIIPKTLISVLLTIALYFTLLMILKISNIVKNSDGITEASLLQIAVDLVPSLFISIVCLVNFMSNKFKYFLTKVILFYLFSAFIIILSNPFRESFLSGLIVFLIGPIQLIIGFILSFFKKE